MARLKISMNTLDFMDFMEVYGEEGFQNLANDYESFVDIFKENQLMFSIEPDIEESFDVENSELQVAL